MEAIWLYCSPLQLGSDRSPDNLALHTCALCPGLTAQKAVFINLKELQVHYVLGHYGRSLKELFYSQYPGCTFPARCLACPQWKGCGQLLMNEEQVILHLGLIHKRLFYLLMHNPRALSLIAQNVCPERWNAHFRVTRSYQAYPERLMEPSVSRKGSVFIDVEAQNAPKGYPVQVLFVDMISPSPDAAGPPHCIVTMQDAMAKYALTHPIMNMMLPQMEVSTIAVHIWHKWVTLRLPEGYPQQDGP